MSNNNQNFESRGVSLTPAQWERCDRLTDEYGKKSRNSFIREAVDFYCAWLEKEHMERFLLPSLESVMDSKIKDSEGRIRNVEFKMGVQIAMLTELLADHLGCSEEDMEQMRADAVRHMKETNGSFRF
jgi:metal-responsive CopG/Arc/MetJ family transcriptional regulator